jgi:hypothetical protein
MSGLATSANGGLFAVNPEKLTQFSDQMREFSQNEREKGTPVFGRKMGIWRAQMCRGRGKMVK